MTIKIRQELNAIISMHEKIINALKTQKVRQDQLSQKYEDNITEEMDLPANRFLNWTRMVQPYVDSIISGKIMDVQLLKQYERFIKELVRYEGEFIINEQDIVDLEYNYDSVVDIVLKLETKILEIRRAYNDELTRAKVAAIKIYQSIPYDKKPLSGHCVYCGIGLEPKLGDGKDECAVCNSLPDEIKPFLAKESSSDEPVDDVEAKDPEFDEDHYQAMKQAEQSFEYEDREVKPQPKIPTQQIDMPFEDDESGLTSEDDEEPEDDDEDYSDEMDEYEKEVDEESQEEVESFVETEEEEPAKKPKHTEVPGMRPKDRKLQKDFKKLMAGLEKKYDQRMTKEVDAP